LTTFCYKCDGKLTCCLSFAHIDHFFCLKSVFRLLVCLARFLICSVICEPGGNITFLIVKCDDIAAHCILTSHWCIYVASVKDVKKPPAASLSKSSTTLPSYPLNYLLFPSGVNVEIDLDEMIGAQNILEEHVSRVWDDQGTTENDQSSYSQTVSARLPGRPFHRRLMPSVRPSPDVSSSAVGYSFGRFAPTASASSSFCRPDFDVSCCSEMDCSIDNDHNLNSLPENMSSMSRHRLIHSTPKSKSVLSRYTASQSDSEMWDDCGSNVEQKQWNTSTECTGCNTCHPHYSSQPNLPAALAHTE